MEWKDESERNGKQKDGRERKREAGRKGLMDGLLEKLYFENNLEREEIILLLKELKAADEGRRQVLLEYARLTADRYYGKKVFMRGLIEFSSVCRQNCRYCGLRAGNANAERYSLTKEEILECCSEGYSLGYRTFVLQSGENPLYTAERMAEIISSIKELYPEAAVTISIGERSFEEYRLMFEAGADRYLLRHETASRRLYEKLHPGMDFDNRRRCLEMLREIGYQVGAGFMVGLPGQTEEDLAEDLLFLKHIQPDMIGIGPFIPHSETPLRDEKGGTVEDTLIMLALTRLFVPDSLMPATTAMGTLHRDGRELALKAGANVVMPNLTPTAMRPKYELYENKICTGDEAAHCRHCIEGRIRAAGFEPDMGRGDSCRAAAPFSGTKATK